MPDSTIAELPLASDTVGQYMPVDDGTGAKRLAVDSLVTTASDASVADLVETDGSDTQSAMNARHAPLYVANPAQFGDGVADATAHIQALLDAAATTRGRVHLPRGTWSVSSLTIDSLVALTGEGLDSKVEQIASTTGAMLSLENDQVQGVKIADLWFYGNRANQTALNVGLSLINSYSPISPTILPVGDAHHSISHVMVSHCKGVGVRISGRGGSRFTSIWSQTNQGDGFWVDGFDSNYTDCDAGNNDGYGWNMVETPTYASNNSFTACKAFYNDFDGFVLGNGSGLRLIGCIAQGNFRHGFRLLNGRDNILTDCDALDNDLSNGGYVGFALEGVGVRHRITGSSYNLTGTTQDAAVSIASTVTACTIQVATDLPYFATGTSQGANRATFTGRGAPVPALWLPGTASVNVSTPDAAAFDITTDVCAVVDVTLPDYTPAAAVILFAKSSTASNFSYDLQLTTAGTLQFRWSTDGTTGAGFASATATVSTSVTDGQRQQFAVTFDANNGASGSSTRFWKRPNPDTEWVQIGTTVVGGATVTMWSGTSPLEIGSRAASSPLLGLVHSFSLRSGIGASGVVGGTEVAEFRSDANVGPRYRDALGNIWTINGSTWAWQIPS